MPAPSESDRRLLRLDGEGVGVESREESESSVSEGEGEGRLATASSLLSVLRIKVRFWSKDQQEGNIPRSLLGSGSITITVLIVI